MGKNEKYKNAKLLIDGKNAFPFILKQINEAKKSIYINMFIWRDDNIGNKIAEAIYNAANKGVKVHLDIDRYGIICELAEESKKSFFHKKVTLNEKVKIKALEIYNKNAKKIENEKNLLYEKIISHPLITISQDIFKADHSKYYIFDDEILLLGGVNIEDKENGKDKEGRIYQDYMVSIFSKEEVKNFKEKLHNGNNNINFINYVINSKKLKLFEIKETYINMIKNAKKNIEINMAYFSPIKEIIDELINAYKRNVNIKIMIPEKANFQDSSNKESIKKLLKKSENKIEVFFTPKMMHTKLIISDNIISIGSANITKKAFKQLDELNMMIDFDENENCPIVDELKKSMHENYLLARKINDYKEISNNDLLYFIEHFFI